MVFIMANPATRAFHTSLESQLPASQPGNMPIVVIGLSHRSSPVTVRERFAFAEARVPATLALMKESKLVDEAVILSTCNRVEIYAARRAYAQEFLATSPVITDHLHKELLKLAHDDPSVLGPDYPGSLV